MRQVALNVLFVVVSLILSPVVVSATEFKQFYSDKTASCYCDDNGNDWYWFCGTRAEINCRHPSGEDNYARGSNEVKWLSNGQSFNWTKRGGQGNYWCCGGDANKIGKFVQGTNWIKTKKSVTKTVVDTVNNTVGKCTWTQKINICGEIDNPEDECTTAVGATDCVDGYVTHNAKCVEPCEDGYVFESATSSKCVKKEVNAHQGVIEGHRVVCPDNKFWDVKTLSCKDKTEWTMISNVAFDECWLCKSPIDLTECLRHVTNGGSLSARPTLKQKCEL